MTAPKYPCGLKLIDSTFIEINKSLETNSGKMTAPVNADVPAETKAVHLCVSTMSVSFGSGTGTPRPLRRFAFKITNENLTNGKYRCDFEAFLEADDSEAPWTPYFVLELLCFA